MSGSLGSSKSDSEESSGFSQDVWGPQGNALGGMYGQMGGMLQNLLGSSGGKGGGKGSGMMGQIPGAVNQMQNTTGDANSAWQNQLQGGAYQGMDLQGNYQNALQGGGNEQFMNQSIMGGAGNNYADAMKGQMQQDSSNRLGQSLAGNDARAAGNQMSGSSRHGLTEAALHKDSNDRLANQQTQVGYNTFDQDLDRKMGIAQRADQFDMGVLNNASGMLGAQNAAKSGGINQTGQMQQANMGQFAPYMAPWQMTGAMSNQIGGPTILGQGEGMGNSSSKGWGASGGAK